MTKENHIRNIVRLMIVSDSHMLLAKYAGGGKVIYFLPGGGIEYNESLFDAAKRELAEEIGVKDKQVRSVMPISVYEHSWDDKGKPIHEISVVCRCDISGLHWTTDVVSKEAHLTFVWQQITQMNMVNLLPADFKELLPLWLKNQQQLKSFFASGMLDSKL